jgi:hypothetical protein
MERNAMTWPCPRWLSSASSGAGVLARGLSRRRARCLRLVLFVALLDLSLAAVALPAPDPDRATVIVAVGAPGEPEYATNFAQQASLWKRACAKAGCLFVGIGLSPAGSTNDRDLLKQAIAAQPTNGLGQLWIVLIGHGTFDGHGAKFNLRGPDVSAAQMALWLRPFTRPLAFIDTTSCSAPFLNALSSSNRVIITATRSGYEQNVTRFGHYLAEAISDPAADLDKDGQVSLLEAFLDASRLTAEFYKLQGRIVTEHALLDDNGDKLGTPADWFQGLRPAKKPQENAAVDGLLAQQFCLIPSDKERKLTPEQRAHRDALERAVFALREQKGKLPEAEYYRELEQRLLELARFYSSSSL